MRALLCVRVPAACVQAEAALAKLLQGHLQGQAPSEIHGGLPRQASSGADAKLLQGQTPRSPSEIHAKHLTSARDSPHSHSAGSFAGLLQPTPRSLGHGPPSPTFHRAGPASPASLSPGVVRPPVSPNQHIPVGLAGYGAGAAALGEMRPASQGSARRRAQAAAVTMRRPQQAAQPYHLSAEAFLKNVTEQRVEQHFSPASQRPPTSSPLSQRPPSSPSRKLDSRHMTGDGAGLNSTGLMYEVRGAP
jgi:hypothetical protein